MARLRGLVFATWLWGSAAVLGLLCLPALLRRDWAMGVSKLWARGALAGLNVICGLDYRVLNAERLPRTAAVLAVKHQSMWETLALTVLLDRPCFVLKKELASYPVFGWYTRADGFIFVDRQAGAKALRSMTAQAADAAARGCQIVIFPEGTRVPPGESRPYQPGVAALVRSLNVECVPAAHDSGLYWRHGTPYREPGTITLAVLPAIPSGTPRPVLMRGLEDAIEPATRALETARPLPSDQAAA